jgi:hypothetical protein
VSSYTSSIPLTLITSNYILPSTAISSISVVTFPYLFNSSLISSYNLSFPSSIVSTPIISLSTFISTGALASSLPQDFITASISGNQYPGKILTPNLWLGQDLTNIINTRNYNVYINFKYSLYLSTSYDTYTWVTTQGSLNTLDNQLFSFGNKGSLTTTRVGSYTYTDINTTLLFNPNLYQMPANVSNFQIQLILNSSINSSSSVPPYFDIYIPAQNNFTVTLSPLF